MAASGYGAAQLDELVGCPGEMPWNYDRHPGCPELWGTGHLLALVAQAMEQLSELDLVGKR